MILDWTWIVLTKDILDISVSKWKCWLLVALKVVSKVFSFNYLGISDECLHQFLWESFNDVDVLLWSFLNPESSSFVEHIQTGGTISETETQKFKLGIQCNRFYIARHFKMFYYAIHSYCAFHTFPHSHLWVYREQWEREVSERREKELSWLVMSFSSHTKFTETKGCEEKCLE